MAERSKRSSVPEEGDKVSALETTEFFRERAARGNKEAVRRILASAPDVPPVAGDEAGGAETPSAR